MSEALSNWDFSELGFTLSLEDHTEPENGPLQHQKSDLFAYNNHNESIFDDYRYFPGLKKEHDSVVKFDANNDDCINHATLKALVVQLTSPEVIDYNLICDFFLTYRMFTDSHTVLDLLLTRLIWALQYINSTSHDSQHIGQLVLLRTFVVLRHWMLNYFVDDFDSDPKLGDTFVFFMNKITNESSFVRDDMVFERKIITDLKTHWVSRVSEFYNVPLPVDQNVFSWSLPLLSESVNFRKLPKSSTHTSIHTSASFRRSAMLSLYDQRAHYKCLIHDQSIANDENPQLSINNLLSQHKSSRTSLNDKLTEFRGRNDRKMIRRPLAPLQHSNVAKHNYKNLTDSSLALKKTSNPLALSENDQTPYTLSGFSTNGHIKLPSSKVQSILPPTPVKKMDVVLKDSAVRSNSRRMPDGPSYDDMDRKTSIKKLVDGLKKSFNEGRNETPFSSPKASSASSFKAVTPTRPESPKVGDRVDILSARIVDELEYLIHYYIAEQKYAIKEYDDKDDISRSEIKYDSPRRESFVDVNVDSEDEADRSALAGKQHLHLENNKSNDDMSMQDLPDLSMDRIDNFFKSSGSTGDKLSEQKNIPSGTNSFYGGGAHNTSGSSSFGRVASLNWNDEGNLNLEHSESLDESLTNDEVFKEDALQAARIVKSGTQYFDVESDLDEDEAKSNSSISTPSDIGNYKEEVLDLSVAMSPQSMKRTVTMQRITRRDSQGQSINKRFSVMSRNSSGSMRKRDSIKSYLTYDSAFSIAGAESAPLENGTLKKKHAIQNLRKAARQDVDDDFLADFGEIVTTTSQWRSDSRSSRMSHGSSIRKSVRFSTLCALTELPFNHYRDSYYSGFPSDRNSQSVKSSAIDDSSVFSIAMKDKSNRPSKTAHKSSSDHSSSNSVAIPGISSYVLKELAAIPDESFSSTGNPVQSALSRLEGKVRSSRSAKVAEEDAHHSPDDDMGQLDPVDECTRVKTFVDEDRGAEREADEASVQNEYFNNTEDILDEINNAVTQDAIDYSSDVEREIQEKPITPIRTKARSTLNIGLSGHNVNALLFNISNSESTSPFSSLTPKAVLDRYSVGSEHLTIAKVMEQASHISFVLSYDSKSLAEHFTMIEKDMLQDIDWKELIELNWNKELTPVNSWLEIIVNENYYTQNKGVNLVIARFNLMVNWIISEILMTTAENERIVIMSRFIHVAHHSQMLQNFSTLMQIILALTSEKILKLKETWKKLPPGDLLTLKNLEELTAPTKNFINIRVCTNQIRPSLGCIPFVGLYLSDLIFNAERPKFVKRSAQKMLDRPTMLGGEVAGSEKSMTLNDSTTASEGDPDYERLINFSRFRTSVHIVKSLSQGIEWSRNYDFPVDEELLRKCLYIKSLDEEEMNYCVKMHSEMTV